MKIIAAHKIIGTLTVSALCIGSAFCIQSAAVRQGNSKAEFLRPATPDELKQSTLALYALKALLFHKKIVPIV